ncbi:MAG: ABC transporter substrate-binding protein [Actinomycetota bacterium]|nr:ABC transporter substrate-binding protein [Actinomycetota bacterium]
MEPIRLGLLMAEPQLAAQRWRNVLELALDDLRASGRLHREVTFVERNPEGLPNGTSAAVIAAFGELRDEGVLGVLGPANGDNCISLQPHIDRAELATVGLCATMRFPSEWCFSVPWGSCPEDALLVASWIVANGHRRLAVITDDLWHSAEYLEYLDLAADRHGLTIVHREQLPATVRDAAQATDEQLERAAEAVERARAATPDVLVHMGPLSLAAVAHCVTDQGWDIPKIANNAFAAAQRPERAALFEGWVGTTSWHDDNELLANLLERHAKQFGEPAGPDFAASVYDGARVLFEGLALAPILNRPGLRAGLERVRGLRSSLGGPENVLSFGPWDHRALKSSSMMVLRRIEGGRSVMEPLPRP